MKTIKTTTLLLLSVSFIIISCDKNNQVQNPWEFLSLKSKFEDSFFIGAALNNGQINGIDSAAIKVLQQEYNTITPENIMKWMYIHPDKNSFFFDNSDKYVALGKSNNMFIVGHTLVWHSQLPQWANELEDSTEMVGQIENHINSIVGRYKGKIHSWDVVNEALNEDGSYRESLFQKVLGSHYINLAFKLAAQANPEAQLLYNDYNLWKPEKRAGVVNLVKQLQSNGTKIDGVGMQGHWGLTEPSIQNVENSILAYAKLGVKVMITELDITVLPNPWDLEGAEVNQDFESDAKMNPYPLGLPDSIKTKLAQRYEDIFRLFLKHRDKIDRVTFWGVNDGQSWLNNWPIKGRTNYPLLFDREFKPKKAHNNIIEIE